MTNLQKATAEKSATLNMSKTLILIISFLALTNAYLLNRYHSSSKFSIYQKQNLIKNYQTRLHNTDHQKDIINDVKEPQGSGIAQYYQDTLSILAKLPIFDLRELIQRCKPSNLPKETDDSEV